jgi:hypothetical protein
LVAGGWIAGAENLATGSPAPPKLNVSSFVVVTTMAAGFWVARLGAGRVALKSSGGRI